MGLTDVCNYKFTGVQLIVQVHCLPEFLLPDNIADILDGEHYQYMIDAVDNAGIKFQRN